MRVVSTRALRKFWEKHPQAEEPLEAWHKVASKARWKHTMDVRADVPTADFVDPLTCFNVGGNDYRLEVDIVYRFGTSYTEWIGTHAEYDKRIKERRK